MNGDEVMDWLIGELSGMVRVGKDVEEEELKVRREGGRVQCGREDGSVAC